MEQQARKLGQKVFKVKIFNYEIEFTNLFKLTRYDFFSMFVLILVSLYWYVILLQVPATMLLLYYFPKLTYVYIIYCLWIVIDRKTASTTGRRWRFRWCRDNPVLDALKNYFSTKLITTSELPAGQNYLFAAYPHALTPLNSVVNFVTNANNIDNIFPEIVFHVVAHDIVFFMPFVREFFLAIGALSCDELSLKRILTSSPSKGVLLHPGGMMEMAHSTTGNVYRIISNRKGFIRVALETGAALVPVFTFGEKNIYDRWRLPIDLTIKGLHLHNFIFPKGRGIFQTHFGFIPKQHPVTAVVGKPIYVPKTQNPTKELIDEYHKKFFDALFKLFEEYKRTCDVAGAEAKLEML